MTPGVPNLLQKLTGKWQVCHHNEDNNIKCYFSVIVLDNVQMVQIWSLKASNDILWKKINTFVFDFDA